LPADPTRIDRTVAVGDEFVIVIMSVQHPADLKLLQIAEAHNALRFLFGLSQRRQQQRRQNGDDGNDHEQLDEREPAYAGKTFADETSSCGSKRSHITDSKLPPSVR
jgi:hypothetical protein